MISTLAVSLVLALAAPSGLSLTPPAVGVPPSSPPTVSAVEWAVYGRALSPSQLAGVLMMLVALVVVGTQRAARQA